MCYRYLQQTVKKLIGNKDTEDMRECLQYHYIHVETQVERLKLLKVYRLFFSADCMVHVGAWPPSMSISRHLYP
jgi:hypothetical protein